MNSDMSCAYIKCAELSADEKEVRAIIHLRRRIWFRTQHDQKELECIVFSGGQVSSQTDFDHSGEA